MKRCEVWWADVAAPARRRPTLLVKRNEAYAVRELVTVAPVTTRIRGIPVEVPLGKKEGLPKACVANLDNLTTIPKEMLKSRITSLPPVKVDAVDDAISFALGL